MVRNRSRRYSLLLLLLGCFLSAPVLSESEGGEAEAGSTAQEKIRQIDRFFDGGGEEGSRAILPFLRDTDLGVRSHAMKRLVDMGEAAIDPLLQSLEEDDIRWLVSGALINIGQPVIRKTVVALRHKSPVVRRNALFILRQLEARAAAASIQDALSDPDASVQIQAIQTVAQFGGEGGLRLILGKVESPEPPVRDAAIQVLSQFGKEGFNALTSLLAYGNPDVRCAVVRTLGTSGNPEASVYLKKALSDTAPVVRFFACQTLGELGAPSAAEALGAMFSDPDATVRDAAAEAMSRMADSARPILFRFLREGNAFEKISAATAIRKAKYHPALGLLQEAMRDPSPEVKVAAVAALMTLADPSSVEGLVNGLRDPEIRWICIMALRQFGETNLRPLLRRSNDPDLDYWKQYVLEGMGSRILDGCLESLKKEEDVNTRIATICSMRQIKDSRAVYPLVALLGDEKLGYVASYVLSQMGEVAVEALLLSLRDENPGTRARAAAALGEIGYTHVVRPLRDLLGDQDPAVRRTAERAIRRITGESPAAGQTPVSK